MAEKFKVIHDCQAKNGFGAKGSHKDGFEFKAGELVTVDKTQTVREPTTGKDELWGHVTYRSVGRLDAETYIEMANTIKDETPGPVTPPTGEVTYSLTIQGKSLEDVLARLK